MKTIFAVLVFFALTVALWAAPFLAGSSAHIEASDRLPANRSSLFSSQDRNNRQQPETSVVNSGMAHAANGVARPETSSGPVTKSPQLTASQQEAAKGDLDNRPSVPVRQGQAWTVIPNPTDPPLSPLTADGAAAKEINAITPHAANDFRYQQVTDLTIPTGNLSEVNSPTVGSMGNTLFFTGNWYAARSSDGGQTFTYVNPATTFTSVNGGFCCDQVANYVPAHDMMLWTLQYKSDGTTNSIRIARAVGSSAVLANSWSSYRFTPQDFQFPTGTYLDFPNVTYSSTFLYLTANVFAGAGTDQDSQGTFTGSIIMRVRLADLAAGGSINYNYYFQTRSASDVGSWRCTDATAATMYCAGWRTTSQLRILHWDDSNDNNVFFDDVNTAAFTYLNRGEGVATSPDGTNFAARSDSRVLGAWVANGVIGFMWNAKQDATFPYPYVVIGRFNESTRARISQNAIWNTTNAWLYPTASRNAAGNLAGLMSFGGGSNFPGTNIWIVDDVEPSFSPLVLRGATTGTNGPATNKWGDYFAVRPHKNFTNTWVAATYSLKNGGAGANAVPRYIWFGRERDFGVSPSPTPTATPTLTPTPTPTPTPSPSPTPTVTPSPAPLQLLLDQTNPGANQVAAMDSQLYARDPFPVVNTANFLNPNQGLDRNTRVVVFVTNLQLLAGEQPSAVVVNLVDGANQSFDVPAEDVRAVPKFSFTQLIFRLPTSLAIGTVAIKVKAHNLTSNTGFLRIRSSGGPPIETATKLIVAAQGGSINLPGGSSVTIPAGALTKDQNVTLSLVSSLPEQPPSGLIVSVGPALSLSFAPVVGSTSRLEQMSADGVVLPNASGPIQFQINFSNSTATGFEGSKPLGDLYIPQLNSLEPLFIGLGGQINLPAKTATLILDPQSFGPPVELEKTTLHVGLSNIQSLNVPTFKRCPAPPVGERYWDGNGFQTFSCDSALPPGFNPSKKTLVVVHGMLSSVESAFGSDCGGGNGAAKSIKEAGNYDQVLGFNYDWGNGINASGQKLAQFLECLRLKGFTNVDLEAHSEGVPVSLAAASQSSLNLQNMVLLGGPIMGTPVANVGTALQTVWAYLPVNHFDCTNKTLDQLMNGAFAADLRTDSQVLPQIRNAFNQRAQHPRVIAVSGDLGFAGELPALKTIIDVSVPFDGIIPVSSARGEGSGLINLQQLPTYHTWHVGLECDPQIIQDVGTVIKSTSQNCSGSVIQISGQITNRNTGQPIAGANVVVVSNQSTLTTFSAANGAYTLCIPTSVRDQTSSVILQVSASGFVSQGVPVNLNSGNQTVNVGLDPNSTNIIIVETPLHHLGDGNFTTPLNAGLQTLTAEGVSFSKSFTISPTQLPPNFTTATLEITINGAEVSDPVVLNGVTIATLNNSAAGPENRSFTFNISLLRSGSNTITLSASPDSFGGFDDFEFSNVRIKLNN